MYLYKYEPNGQGRSKVINYGQYQRQGPGNINLKNIPQQPPDDEDNLSTKNRKLADSLARLTLKAFKIELDEKELDKDAKQIKTGLDYFI